MTTTMGCSAFAVRLTSEGRRVEPKLSTERAREGIMVNIAYPAAKLRDLRDAIDDINAAIIHMLAERFRYTRTVGILKAEHKLPSRDPGREAEQISRCGILPRSANSTRVLPKVPGSCHCAAAQLGGGATVAGQPARQLLPRIGASRGVDLGDILGVLRELDNQPVGRGHSDRFAIAVIALAVGFACGLEAPLQLVIGAWL